MRTHDHHNDGINSHDDHTDGNNSYNGCGDDNDTIYSTCNGGPVHLSPPQSDPGSRVQRLHTSGAESGAVWLERLMPRSVHML